MVLSLPVVEQSAELAAGSISPEVLARRLRPIADRISWPDLLALYGDPRGRHGDLDAF